MISIRPKWCEFQSTPPARGATYAGVKETVVYDISIHAPREGGDYHALRGMSRGGIFQSTPPARGATAGKGDAGADPAISIHAPREGGDGALMERERVYFEFQSTPPARGATIQPQHDAGRGHISIHAPREGGDHGWAQGVCQRCDFNPRPPRGGRPRTLEDWERGVRFQSTPPARGATAPRLCSRDRVRISIHAPREGGDHFEQVYSDNWWDFNPRPPRGGRL